MRILSMRSRILSSTLRAKLMNFLAQAPFLNKTKRPRVKDLKSLTMTISCQCTFKKGGKTDPPLPPPPFYKLKANSNFYDDCRIEFLLAFL